MAAGTVAVPSLDLTKFNKFAQKLVESGRYTGVNQVLEAAMDALLREEYDDKAKEATVREAIEKGDASGIY